MIWLEANTERSDSNPVHTERSEGCAGIGASTHNSVRQMLKNWRKQGLIRQVDDGHYAKVNG